MKLIPLVMMVLFVVSLVAQARKRKHNHFPEPQQEPEPFERENVITASSTVISDDPLHDSRAYVREKAVLELSKKGDPAVIADLVEVIEEDEDYATAMKAGEGLVQFGPKAVPPLLECLQSENVNAREIAATILGNIGHKSAVEGLVAALDDVSMWVRRSSAESLGKIKSPVAIEGLEKLIDDSDVSVQKAAIEALMSIGTPDALAALSSSETTE